MNTFIWDPEEQPEQNYGSLLEKTRVGAAAGRTYVGSQHRCIQVGIVCLPFPMISIP